MAVFAGGALVAAEEPKAAKPKLPYYYFDG